jgi:hypothetical protein
MLAADTAMVRLEAHGHSYTEKVVKSSGHVTQQCQHVPSSSSSSAAYMPWWCQRLGPPSRWCSAAEVMRPCCCVRALHTSTTRTHTLTIGMPLGVQPEVLARPGCRGSLCSSIRAGSWCAVLCCAVLCCAVLCCAVLPGGTLAVSIASKPDIINAASAAHPGPVTVGSRH